VRQLPRESMRSEVTWRCPTCSEVRQRSYVLLDGHHRYTIYQRHEIPFAIVEAPAWVKTRENAKLWMIRNQLGRRNLPRGARVELALLMKSIVAEQARERQRQAGREKLPQNSTEAIETRAELAKAADVSTDTIRKGEVVFREADEPMKVAVRTGERSIHSVYQALRPPKPRPSPSGHGEGSTAHPPFIPPFARVGPDASVDPRAPAVRVTTYSPGHETSEPSVASPPRSDGPSAHQEDLGTPAHRCLTLMGALYAELQTMEDLHDMISICQVSSEQTRADYLQQCTYIIRRLQGLQQALQATIASEEVPRWGEESCQVLAGSVVASADPLEEQAKENGDGGRAPSMDAKHAEDRDVSHAPVDPAAPIPTLGAKASAEAACDEGAFQALDERIVATFPRDVPPRRDEVSAFVRRLNEEVFPPPHGARAWHMAAMWQRLRALGYPISGPLRKSC
jgi:hypothetical protein